LLFDDGCIGWLFLLVKGYFLSILHQKAGAGDAVGGGKWTDGLLLTDHSKVQISPIIVEINHQELRLSPRNTQVESKIK
jgi:hypothetical protein